MDRETKYERRYPIFKADDYFHHNYSQKSFSVKKMERKRNKTYYVVCRSDKKAEILENN